jgi:hypothetical protein
MIGVAEQRRPLRDLDAIGLRIGEGNVVTVISHPGRIA